MLWLSGSENLSGAFEKRAPGLVYAPPPPEGKEGVTLYTSPVVHVQVREDEACYSLYEPPVVIIRNR